MAHWYYKGSTTTPVEIPGRGPVVITPKSRFEAPESAVAHLKSLIVRLPDPPSKEPEVAPAVESLPEIVTKAPETERRSLQEAPADPVPDQDHAEDVVESDPSSQVESFEDESEPEEAEADQANESHVPPAKKKKKHRQPREGQS